jgi:hypothetical protein
MHDNKTTNFLILGEIISHIGIKGIKKYLPELLDQYKIDAVIANIENTTNGKGINLKDYKILKDLNVNFFTSGNHIWTNKESIKLLKTSKDVIRPFNYPKGVLGKGYITFNIKDKKFLLINIQGRIFMNAVIDCPFNTTDKFLNSLKENYDGILVDIHAEATSEKIAFAKYFSNRISLIYGTHTHVMTADECILDNYTGFITDVGFIGENDSCLGADCNNVIKKFLYQTPYSYRYNKTGNGLFNAIIAKITNKKTSTIQKIQFKYII